MSLRDKLLTEATPEEQAQQEVLDAVNVVLTHMTDSVVRIRMGAKGGKGFYKKELKSVEKQIENMRQQLIKMSDDVLHIMVKE
jgi:hypothetical protein